MFNRTKYVTHNKVKSLKSTQCQTWTDTGCTERHVCLPFGFKFPQINRNNPERLSAWNLAQRQMKKKMMMMVMMMMMIDDHTNSNNNSNNTNNLLRRWAQ